MLRLQTRFLRTSAAAPFTVFQSTGMLMARPVPLQFTTGDEPTIAREGYVSLTVIPRILNAESTAEEPKSTFDKEKKLSVKLRAKQIGQLISWRLNNGSKAPLLVNAYMTGSIPTTLEFKHITSASDPAEPQIQLTITPKSGDAAPVSLPISLGEVKSLQVLLEACLPDLYGWVGKVTQPRQSGTWSTAAAAGKEKSPEDFFNQFK